MSKSNLLVLAPNNDPFNSGTETHVEAAKWFARIYEKVGYRGIHLRRLHYRAFGAGLEDLNGQPYANTEALWAALQNGSRYARYLGLVDAEDFHDNRAPAPLLSVSSKGYTPEPTYVTAVPSHPAGWCLPKINTTLNGWASPRAEHYVDGYYYEDGLQPNLVEVWSEKSGDNATLEPLARHYGINYCPGVGFQSVTNIRRMFRRVRDTGKPTRILYISDFDPAGQNMPVQVGRQTQFAFWQLERLAEVEDVANVKLEPIALTHEQVERLSLPRKVGKGGDVVEIDALEANHPGALASIVQTRVEALQDLTLRQRVVEAKELANRRVEEALRGLVARHRSEAEQTVAEFNAIAEQYRERLEVLSAELEGEVGHLRERFAQQQEAFEAEVEGLEVDLPEMPTGAPLLEADGWMFDSDREFIDQTAEFRRRKRGESDD